MKLLALISVNVLLILIYYVLRPRKSKLEAHDNLKSRYNQIDNRANIIFTAGWILLILILGYSLQWLHPKMFSNYIYLNTITPVVFYVASAFACLPLLFLLYKKYLTQRAGVDWNEFLQFYSQKYRLDPIKAQRYLLNPLAALALIVVLLALNTFTKFTETQIIFSDFSSFARSYSYEKVKKVVLYENIIAPNGEKKAEKSYRIYFKDGNYWSSRSHGYTRFEKNHQIINLVTAKSNLKVQYEESTHAYH